MSSHSEIRLFDTLIERFDLVQIPVRPLNRASFGIAGHYLDEFAEAHGKLLVVREAIGAGVPCAGTGCAIARGMIEKVARAGGGRPFDAASLTEDYELGLRLREHGGRGIFVRMRAAPGAPLVAVEAYFPHLASVAVRQKARWINGIALSGWDRLGWHGGAAELWMRLRDRRAPLAAIVLAAAYAALLLWGMLAVLKLARGQPLVDPSAAWFTPLTLATTALLTWRLAMRAAMVARDYGPREAMWSIPRVFVANLIAMAAARRAVWVYLRPGRTAWDKTPHDLPVGARA